MHVEQSIVNDIKAKQLHWFDHVQQMPENQLPNKTCSGHRKKRRHRLIWGQEERIGRRPMG